MCLKMTIKLEFCKSIILGIKYQKGKVFSKRIILGWEIFYKIGVSAENEHTPFKKPHPLTSCIIMHFNKYMSICTESFYRSLSRSPLLYLLYIFD